MIKMYRSLQNINRCIQIECDLPIKFVENGMLNLLCKNIGLIKHT